MQYIVLFSSAILNSLFHSNLSHSLWIISFLIPYESFLLLNLVIFPYALYDVTRWQLTNFTQFKSFSPFILSFWKQTIHARSIVTGSRWYLFSITYNRASHRYFIPSFTLMLKFRSRMPLYWHSALLSSAFLHSGPLSPLDLNTTPFTPIALANRW